ncbi:hypothetical protein vseg_005766 [Gypsophila vaccaria]
MGIFSKKNTNSPSSSSSSSSQSSSRNSTSHCSDLRTAYHNCFNRWYSEKFVKGDWQKEECVAEWAKYRDCLSKHLEDKHLSRFLEPEACAVPSSAD